MQYRIYAGVVVCLHMAFVVFVLLGGFVVLRWRCLAWVHVLLRFGVLWWSLGVGIVH